MTRIISTAQAASIASQWGSYMNDGDPGAIFYTFPDKGRPDWSAEDRDRMINQIDLRLDDMGAHPDFIETDDQRDLWNLRAWVIAQYGEPGEPVTDAAWGTLDDFTSGYVETAIWLLDDEVVSKAGGIGHDDIPKDTLNDMAAECRAFQAANRADLDILYAGTADGQPYTAERAGHDLWLTRNGHGSGYWDRDFRGNAAAAAAVDRISKAARALGETELDVEFPDLEDEDPENEDDAEPLL